MTTRSRIHLGKTELVLIGLILTFGADALARLLS